MLQQATYLQNYKRATTKVWRTRWLQFTWILSKWQNWLECTNHFFTELAIWPFSKKLHIQSRSQLNLSIQIRGHWTAQKLSFKSNLHGPHSYTFAPRHFVLILTALIIFLFYLFINPKNLLSCCVFKRCPYCLFSH